MSLPRNDALPHLFIFYNETFINSICLVVVNCYSVFFVQRIVLLSFRFTDIIATEREVSER